MNGPIAQIVALTCHGNAFLSGRAGNAFFPANSTCEFCERITFVTVGRTFFGRKKETEVARSPNEWFPLLKSRGALGIRLCRESADNPEMPDRMSAGLIGGGGMWAMEILLPDKMSEYWVGRWEAGDPNAADQKIWRVTYGCVSKGSTAPLTVPVFAGIIRDLDQSLREIRGFSARIGTDQFTKCFDQALDTIATRGSNRQGHHQDLAPAGVLSDEAAMILDACQTSWVFGTMGSWNDLSFDQEGKQETYDRVSECLFRALNAAIGTAATSTIA